LSTSTRQRILTQHTIRSPHFTRDLQNENVIDMHPQRPLTAAQQKTQNRKCAVFATQRVENAQRKKNTCCIAAKYIQKS